MERPPPIYREEKTMNMSKLQIYDSPSSYIKQTFTLRLRQPPGTNYVNLDVVDPVSGVRLDSGTLMRFFTNGEVTYKPMSGCRQGNVRGKIRIRENI